MWDLSLNSARGKPPGILAPDFGSFEANTRAEF
jgi:hypothetical protein